MILEPAIYGRIVQEDVTVVRDEDLKRSRRDLSSRIPHMNRPGVCPVHEVDLGRPRHVSEAHIIENDGLVLVCDVVL